MEFYHKERDDGAFKVRYESEVYRLLPRKQMLYEANRELRFGFRYLLWSRYARGYYERVIDDRTAPENLKYYIDKGWMWWFLTDLNKEEIREDVERSQL